MNLHSIFLLFLFALSSTVIADSGRYPKDVTPLSKNHSFFQSGGKGQQFWKLMPAYRAQKTDSSCSLASTTVVINALVPSEMQNAEKKIFNEEDLLALSGSTVWREATKMGGKGMALKALHQDIQTLLKNMKLDSKFAVNYFEMKNSNDAEVFTQHLAEFERGQGYLILMYGQGNIMGDKAQYPHYSPVGAYDKDRDQILMLDVDGDWYEPYWVSTKKMITSMTKYDEEIKCQRGYIWVSHHL